MRALDRTTMSGPGGLDAIRAVAADGHEVVRLEPMGQTFFLGENTCERLLTSPDVAGSVAMGVLEQVSGVTSGPLHDLWSVLMFGKDGEEHGRVRGRIAAHFTPRAIESLRDSTTVTADELLDAASGPSFDVFADYTLPLAATVQGDLIGIPRSDLPTVVPWAMQLVHGFGAMTPDDVVATEAAAIQFCAYLDDLFATRRHDPSDDLIGTLLTGIDADTVDEETRGLVANLMFGGLDAVAKAITNTLQLLLEQPDQRSAAAECPMANVVAEGLRFRPTAPFLGRTALTDLTIDGLDIPTGDVFLVSLAGPTANPHRFPEPSRFDVTRPIGKQFAFGAGPHHCVGANLAKLVIDVGVERFLSHFPNAHPAPPPAAPIWSETVFAGYTSLPVVLC